eukprot:scaffold17434_cov114-Isochrysis_galbana.AAC.3
MCSRKGLGAHIPTRARPGGWQTSARSSSPPALRPPLRARIRRRGKAFPCTAGSDPRLERKRRRSKPP